MKIVSFNIRTDCKKDGINNFEFRAPMIKEKLNIDRPDIICFQEVLPNVVTWLKANLTDYDFVGGGRDKKLSDEYTLIGYRRTQFDLIDLKMFWLSPTPLIPASRYENQSDCPRTCTSIMLKDLASNKCLRVTNTHLDHIGEEARTLGSRQILEYAKEIKMPHIITGDFNATPDEEAVKLLGESGLYKDLTAELDGTFHDYGRRIPASKIDYIFASSDVEYLKSYLWTDSRDGVYLSDHYPVCVEFI